MDDATETIYTRDNEGRGTSEELNIASNRKVNLTQGTLKHKSETKK